MLIHYTIIIPVLPLLYMLYQFYHYIIYLYYTIIIPLLYHYYTTIIPVQVTGIINSTSNEAHFQDLMQSNEPSVIEALSNFLKEASDIRRNHHG